MTIADDNTVGVRVTESNGSTNVIEYQNGDFGVSQSAAAGQGFPFQDTYIVSLTKAPAPGETIEITVGAQATRTSETGGIVSYSQQLQLCVLSVTPNCATTTTMSDYQQFVTLDFTAANWNTPQTVWVRALENQRVDGMDTHVFAQQLAQLNDIQGPLLINGGEGADRTGLLEREPVMLPGERNITPSMGVVDGATEAITDSDGNVVTPSTITIDPSTLAQVSITQPSGVSDNSVQEIAINAIGGTFTLTCGGCGTTPDLAFNAPAVTIENALKALLGRTDLTVSVNGNVYELKFLGAGPFPTLQVGGSGGLTTAHVGTLVPINPLDLTNYTIEITQGAAKNKTRIITAAALSGAGWVLTLDKPWFSPFTMDASLPSGTPGPNRSSFTLLLTNPNLLVNEAQEANLLFLYDTDNPASYNDPHLTPNPFGEGQIFFDSSKFGPFDAHGNQANLNQFRITGFGMGENRCIGGPGRAAGQVDDGVLADANACTGPVGGNEPGGITFKGLQDIELNLGPGNNLFTIHDTGPSTLLRVNTGAGDDVVNVEKIEGHTFVNLGGGNDVVNIHNTQQQLSDLLGLLTVSGDSPQANVINLTNGSPRQGTAVDPVSAEQKLTVDGTGGTFTLSYAPTPLHLTASQDGANNGMLAKGTYFYVVTAVINGVETLASPETFDQTVSANGKIDLSWYPVPLANGGYRIYRGTTAGGENVLVGTTMGTSFVDGGSGSTAAPPTTSATIHAPVTLNFGASAATVKAALETLLGAGNVKVQKAGDVYYIFFQGAFAATAVPLLFADAANLTSGAGEVDRLNIDDSGSTAANDAALLTSTSLTGLDLPASNQIQQLVLDATGGTFTLTYTFPLVTLNVAASTAAAAGTLGAGTHYYVVTALTPDGETIASAEVAALTAPGGSVNLTWDPVAGATSYRVYRGATPGHESEWLAAATNSFTDTGAAGTLGTPPLTATAFVHQTTPVGGLQWNASAADVQHALELLPGIGTGNVAVTKNDDVYVIRFQGTLSDAALLPLTAGYSQLQKATANLGGTITTAVGQPSMATITTRTPGFSDPETNQVQLLTVDATSGTYVLSFHAGSTHFTTLPIAYNANAEQLRQAIQNAIAIGESTDPNARLFTADKVDVTVDLYSSAYTNGAVNNNIYVLNFQGELRKADGGVGVDTVTVDTAGLTGSATISTRMDGIDYYGFEQVNILTGAGTDTFNVQGTTRGSNGFTGAAGLPVAQTNITTNAPAGAMGADRAYLSSNADVDGSSWNGFDFLTGNLDDFQGALNIDLGGGRHRLFLSDEGSSHPDDYAITDSIGDAWNKSTAGLASDANIYVTRAGLPGISYKTSATGNLFDGVNYWTGSGDDTVHIDGTKPDGAQRTTTILDTGLGSDHVTVNLTAAQDGFFVLETSGGSSTGDAVAHALPAVQDNDVVDAHLSTLPLVIIGGWGSDSILGGQGNDIILGDSGIVQYAVPGSPDTLLAQFGFGGRGDVIDAQGATLGTPIDDPRWVFTYVPDMALGGNDTIYGNGGEDILVGGAANDRIDGGNADDLIFGDAVQLFRRDVIPTVIGDITNPRFQTLSGTQIYPTTGLPTDATNAFNSGLAQNYRDPNGTYAPDWAEYQITNLYQSTDTSVSPVGSYGDDYIAGGAANDEIFGQQGNDTIQGDGSIDYSAAGCSGVGSTWNTAGDYSYAVCPSMDGAGDGSDYIEGGAGNDVIFGNQGQDDLIGGSSNLFSLNLPSKRADGADIIFGGSGTAIALSMTGDTSANGHSNDSDAILGDNGDIIRLVARRHGLPELRVRQLRRHGEDRAARDDAARLHAGRLRLRPGARRDRPRRARPDPRRERRRLHLRHGRQRRDLRRRPERHDRRRLRRRLDLGRQRRRRHPRRRRPDRPQPRRHGGAACGRAGRGWAEHRAHAPGRPAGRADEHDRHAALDGRSGAGQPRSLDLQHVEPERDLRTALRQRHHLRRPRQRRDPRRRGRRRDLRCGSASGCVHQQLRRRQDADRDEAEHDADRERLLPSAEPGQRPRLQRDADLPGAVRPERSVPRDLAERRRLPQQDVERPAVAPELRSERRPDRRLLGDLRRLHACGSDGRQRHHLRRPRQRLGRRWHRPRHHVRRLGQRLPERRRLPGHERRPERRPGHEPVVGGLRLRRSRPRRDDREHRRRPPGRLGRRVQQLPRPVRPVRHAHDQPQPVAGPPGPAHGVRQELRCGSVPLPDLRERSGAERRAVRRDRAGHAFGRSLGRPARRPARPAARPRAPAPRHPPDDERAADRLRAPTSRPPSSIRPCPIRSSSIR